MSAAFAVVARMVVIAVVTDLAVMFPGTQIGKSHNLRYCLS